MPYADPVKRRAYHLAYQRSHTDSWKDDRLRREYGITLDDYKSMARAQKDLCKICGKAWAGKRILQVDHDHKTGKVRGLLCIPCNTRLGIYQVMKDSIYKFEDYLKEFK